METGQLLRNRLDTSLYKILLQGVKIGSAASGILATIGCSDYAVRVLASRRLFKLAVNQYDSTCIHVYFGYKLTLLYRQDYCLFYAMYMCRP